jgi:predicted DNA repair protein MutK
VRWPWVTAILEARGAARWITFEVVEKVEETYRQERRGRPNEQTRYVKEERTRIALSYRSDHVSVAAEMCVDGIFPLITNDLSHSDE